MSDRLKSAQDVKFTQAGVGHASARECIACKGRSCSYLGSRLLKRRGFTVGWICGRCAQGDKSC